MGRSPVLARAFDLDFALNAGLRLGMHDLDVEEFRALKILRLARDKHQKEQIENAQRGRG